MPRAPQELLALDSQGLQTLLLLALRELRQAWLRQVRQQVEQKPQEWLLGQVGWLEPQLRERAPPVWRW